MKKLFLVILACVMAVCASAQSKGEVSLYKKTLKNVSMKSVEKFLKKYPKSVLAPKVEYLKDSLILDANTSRIGKEEALALAAGALDAVGWKKDGTEHVLALGDGLALDVLSPSGTVEEHRSIERYTLLEAPGSLILTSPLEMVLFGKSRFLLHFSYLNDGAAEKEFVEVLYDPAEDIVFNAMFYGKALPLQEGQVYRIEGQSPENIEGLSLSAETVWLRERINGNPALVPIAKADALTDASIDWWLARNPKAETSAKKLDFGVLDPESSLAQKYRKAAKEKGLHWNVALFEDRGWTVIVAGSKSSGNCSLVWCEPVNHNRAQGKVLNTIYFENDGNTLDLVYYKGKTTFKYKISMSNGNIKR